MYKDFQNLLLESIRDNMERSLELLDAAAMQQLKDKMLPKSPNKDNGTEVSHHCSIDYIVLLLSLY